MNDETKKCSSCAAKAAYAIAVLGALLIVAYLDHVLKTHTQAPPVDAGRAEERAKDLAEIRNAEADALNNTGWMDQSKGIVRLRIDDAMNLLVETWKNPAVGRSNMLDRVAKANPPPPPAAPPPKSPFE